MLKEVMAAISAVQPSQLFVVADGPDLNQPGEAQLVSNSREVVDQSVTWDCTIEKNYASEKLGLKTRVVSGLTWVFDQVDRAIILEDDCVPDPSFFIYCKLLLDRYAEDDRIMSIGGVNFQFENHKTPYSYYFSIYNHVWGWASWRRAWSLFDENMSLWPEVHKKNMLAAYFQEKGALQYWNKRFQAVYENKIDSWAYRWTYSCWMQNGLSILPSINLVSNIGGGLQATHTQGQRNPLLNIPVEEMKFPLSHPPYVQRHAQADLYTQSQYFRNRPLAPLKRRVKLFLARFSGIIESDVQ